MAIISENISATVCILCQKSILKSKGRQDYNWSKQKFDICAIKFSSWVIGEIHVSKLNKKFNFPMYRIRVVLILYSWWKKFMLKKIRKIWEISKKVNPLPQGWKSFKGNKHWFLEFVLPSSGKSRHMSLKLFYFPNWDSKDRLIHFKSYFLPPLNYSGSLLQFLSIS